MVRNNQLLYNMADLILKVQVIDSSRRKLFKRECNCTNKKELANLFYLLKSKYNIDIPNALRKEANAWMLG